MQPTDISSAIWSKLETASHNASSRSVGNAQLLDIIGKKIHLKLRLSQIILEITQLIQGIRPECKTKIYLAIDDINFGMIAKECLAGTATMMVLGSIDRLHSRSASELLIFLKNNAGEIRLSAVDNSDTLPVEDECMQIQQLILPLGGLHRWQRKGDLIESAISFLHRPIFADAEIAQHS